jgi:hypothetical protein
LNFEKVSLEALLDELSELPADWMDGSARDLVGDVRAAVGRLRAIDRPIAEDDLSALLRERGSFLDVARLFLGQGQEPVAHRICAEMKAPSMTWARLRGVAYREPERMARALLGLGLADVIGQHLDHRWEVEDVLIDRYKMTRGRAIAGQRRGRGLEDEVEAVLKAAGVPFQRGVTFVGKKGATAKCDFAVPSKDQPKIVIESKGFEATGSKLTDFLGDVLKIVQAKGYHMYFFLVTDGRGWRNRVSDLRKLVEHHQNGDVDMIYTSVRLSQLGAHVRQIYEGEGPQA